MARFLFFLWGLLLAFPVGAGPLPADRAFVFSASLNQDQELVLQWDIAPGYYLYRDRISLTPLKGKKFLPETIVLPEGISHRDEIHGHYQIFSDSVQVPVVLKGVSRGILQLDIAYQGCSSDGFCYTPIRKTLNVDLSKVVAPALLDPYVHSADEVAESNLGGDQIEHFLTGNRFLMVLGFLGLGLLLAFTPCVLPMVPILSAIIVGQRRANAHLKPRSFLLSLTYVAGMAITYAFAGVVIALIGRNIQSALQQPWVLILFSGVFILLALSLFGLYELQLPVRWQRQLGKLTGRQQGGTFLGVFLMGCLSTLIVSPCVSAPLVGVLAFIGQTGDVWLGLLALASLGIGMGLPLLLIGLSAGHLLPRTGPWMTALERVFGVVMLGMAVLMLMRVFPVTGIAGGGGQKAVSSTLFTTVHSPAELDQGLREAHRAGRPVFLDFYADWCAPCVLMDRSVFSRADVQAALQPFSRLRVDLTAHRATDRQILQRFQQVGPPAMVFFDCSGRMMTHLTVSGETGAQTLLTRIQSTRQTSACQTL